MGISSSYCSSAYNQSEVLWDQITKEQRNQRGGSLIWGCLTMPWPMPKLHEKSCLVRQQFIQEACECRHGHDGCVLLKSPTLIISSSIVPPLRQRSIGYIFFLLFLCLSPKWSSMRSDYTRAEESERRQFDLRMSHYAVTHAKTAWEKLPSPPAVHTRSIQVPQGST